MATATAGSLAPLKHSTFAVLWTATVIGNTGTFMRDVASGWLVTDLSPSPAMVALIQAAATLPAFLLAIPAGVLADIVDRRRFLIFSQMFLLTVGATLLVLTATGRINIGYLAALTFLGGVGAALAMPAWQAVVPGLVPREQVRAAIALNSMGTNVARAIGPAMGGLLLAAFGAAAAYGADVMSYFVILAALLWWRAPKSAENELSEHFAGAFRSGLRYLRADRELHVVLARAVGFFLFASCLWGLLPLVARQLLGGTADFYGLLLGAIGLGAIVGAFCLPWLRQRLGADRLLLAASLGAAVVLFGLGFAPVKALAVVLLLVFGVFWITAVTTMNSAAQTVLPNWVRGRGLAVYLMAFNGAMTAGSLAWGLVAQGFGLEVALWLGGLGLAVASMAFRRLRLPPGDADLTPSNFWPEPLLAAPVTNDRGPVMVQVEYVVDPVRRQEFGKAIERLSHMRRRDGAYLWGVYEDAAEPGRIVEWFLVESWVEHLRQHRRVSVAGADLQREVIAFHQGTTPPRVSHLLSLHVADPHPNHQAPG